PRPRTRYPVLSTQCSAVTRSDTLTGCVYEEGSSSVVTPSLEAITQAAAGAAAPPAGAGEWVPPHRSGRSASRPRAGERPTSPAMTNGGSGSVAAVVRLRSCPGPGERRTRPDRLADSSGRGAARSGGAVR